MNANTELKFCKVRNVKTPTRGTPGSAGIDLYIPEDLKFSDIDDLTQKITHSSLEITRDGNALKSKVLSMTLAPGASVMIPSGLKMKVPDGHAFVLFNKSGVSAKQQLDVLACVIDQDYEGEVHINLVNSGSRNQTIFAGQKIVQGLVLPIEYSALKEVDTPENLFSNSDSLRGEGGFGSTGTK